VSEPTRSTYIVSRAAVTVQGAPATVTNAVASEPAPVVVLVTSRSPMNVEQKAVAFKMKRMA
jgi:hypothetical protein